MKTMALLFLLTAFAPVAAAQSPTNSNQPAPLVVIRDARVVEFSIGYTGGPLSMPYPWQDRFNGPDTRIHIYAGSAAATPEDFTSNERAFLAHMENLKASVKVSAKALFCLTIKNTGTQQVKGFRLQFMFSNFANGTRYAPYEKYLKVKLKPGEEKSLSSEVALRKAPDDLLKAINSGQNRNDIQLIRVEYEDGSVWARP